jgi:hypothetical protein
MPGVPELRERTARWCLGLRSAGVRKLDPGEAEQLRGQARMALRRLWLLIPIAILIVLSFGGFALLMGPDPSEPPWYRLVPACILLVLGGGFLPAAALLISRDIMRDRRATLVDLRSGVVEQFRVEESGLPADPAAGDKASEGEIVLSADVLPFSKQVLLLNGARPAKRRQAQVYESAPPPGAVARYALPADLLEDILASPPADGQLDRRRLTQAERVEIADRARRARRPSLGLLLLLLCAFVGTVSSLASPPAPTTAAHGFCPSCSRCSPSSACVSSFRTGCCRACSRPIRMTAGCSCGTDGNRIRRRWKCCRDQD